MTTEIAIMNKSAIALAADSAVSIKISEDNYKTYNTANKVFALSKHEPIGIMIFGNASLTGVPWETIVKMFRDELNDSSFKLLEGYCEHFLEFLRTFPFPDEHDKIYVESIASTVIEKIISETKCKIADSSSELDANQIHDILVKIIDKYEKESLKESKKTILSDDEIKKIINEYKDDTIVSIQKSFSPFKLEKEDEAKLLKLINNYITVGVENQSGVVISGFGEEELFPSCISYDISGVLFSKIIMREKKVYAITFKRPSAILPFAQSDDVLNFILGIDPNLYDFIESTFSASIEKTLPKKIINKIKKEIDSPDINLDEINSFISEICTGTYKSLHEGLELRMQMRYIIPVFNATGYLSKSELASMAETLVNLVSFRKQVTMEDETVGGPIDVLVITKGDGPVWIKRKHYFKSELNHHFFSNYLK